MPSKSCPAPTAAAKWARPRASTPRKISAPTTLSPPTKTTTNASSANLDECFIDKIGIIAGLRPIQGGFQRSLIPDAGRASIAFNLIGVHGQHFGHGQVVGHRASFLYNGPYFSWLARYAPITWERGLAFLRFS